MRAEAAGRRLELDVLCGRDFPRQREFVRHSEAIADQQADESACDPVAARRDLSNGAHAMVSR
jgi:hypothetical protein